MSVLNMKNKKSILFVQPDYHCSFIYRDQLKKLGWIADIYVPWSYPQSLLYSNKGIIRPPRFNLFDTRAVKYINYFLLFVWWVLHFWRYQYHLYYGRPPKIFLLDKQFGFFKFFGKDFSAELCLSKFFGVKLIFLPTGCHDDETKEEFTKLDNGNVCGNCGAWDKCSDDINLVNFSRIRRYFNMQIGVGQIDSTQFKMSHIKYKSIDLTLWSPSIEIPSQNKLPKSSKIRILHSAYLANSNRNWKNRNIKGSPFVLRAIEKLKSEGFPVEYFYISDKPSREMRYYQVQSDIVVEQLIYGWWGSSFVETAALGKPVVCYLRPSWKKFFLKCFPQYNDLPIVEADTKNIYEVLKTLVIDESYRLQKGNAARRFAEQHFNPISNTRDLIKSLEAL